VTSSGETALHCAATLGNVSCLKSLIAAGVPIDAMDSQHRTALDLARISSHRHCARSVCVVYYTGFPPVWSAEPRMFVTRVFCSCSVREQADIFFQMPCYNVLSIPIVTASGRHNRGS